MGTPRHGPQSMYSSSLSLSNLGGTGRIEGGWEGGGVGGGLSHLLDPLENLMSKYSIMDFMY